MSLAADATLARALQAFGGAGGVGGAGGTRYASLQALRGVAALMVVLYHLGLHISQPKYFDIAAFAVPFSFGHAGVEFFFVLSGFIITRAHRGDLFKPAALPAYLLKRFFRIYPAYWVVFVVVYAGALAMGNQSETLPQSAAVLLKSLLLLPQDPAVVGGTGAPVIWVAWTLQYEMYFYLWGALAIAGRAWLLGCALVLAVLAAFCEGGCGFLLAFATSGFLLHFLAGTVVALVAERLSVTRRAASALAAAGGLLFAVAAVSEVVGTALFGSLFGGAAYTAGAALMVLGAVKLEDAGLVLGSARWLQRLGDASYSLYLVHQPVMSLLCRVAIAAGLAGSAGAALAWCLLFAACIGVGIALHVAVERPVLRRCAALLKRRPGNSPR